MGESVTRRRFVQASAAAAATAALEPSAFAQRPDGPNVLLVIIDSLRADAVYDGWARTPTMDALLRQGMRFTQRLPRGDAHHPGAQLDPQRPPPVPLPRLVRPRPACSTAPGWEPLDHPDPRS